MDFIKTRSDKVQISPVLSPTGARFTKLAAKKTKRRVPWVWILTIGGSPLLFGLGMIGQLGLIGIALYAVLALVLRLPSKSVFTLSFLALVYMMVLQIIGLHALASALAVYAYLILAVGSVELGREVKTNEKLWFKKH